MAIKSIISGNPTFTKTVPEGVPFLNVAEFFYDTIQGENFVGWPAAFLRLQGCTLCCSWCFHPNTLITTVDRKKQKIQDIRVGEKLWTLDEHENLVETTVQEVMTRTVSIDDLVRIEVDGRHDAPIVTTLNHKFYIKDRGWVQAADLKEGDIIISTSETQLRSTRMKKKNPMDSENIRRKVSETQKRLYTEGVLVPYERTPEHREYQASLKRGDLNPMKNPETVRKNAESHWRGQSGLEKSFEKAFERLNLPILFVGDTKKAVGDGKEGFRFPDFVVEGTKKLIEVYDSRFPFYVEEGKRTEEGYEKWKREHYSKFGYETLFLTEKDLTSENLQQKLFNYCFNGQTITKISREFTDHQKAALFGTRDVVNTEVYNLSCSPYNTYLVGRGALVHNCDSKEVWRFGNPYTYEELFTLMDETDIVQKLEKGEHLVLTGGSPMKQEKGLIGFLEAFQERYGFLPYIEVENESTRMPSPEFVKMVSCWNNSPKLSHSGNAHSHRYKPEVLRFLSSLENSWFKFVVSTEEDWQEIKRDYIDPGYIMRDQIVLMPLGATKEELFKNRDYVVEMATRETVRYSSREHVAIWDKKTGV